MLIIILIYIAVDSWYSHWCARRQHSFLFGRRLSACGTFQFVNLFLAVTIRYNFVGKIFPVFTYEWFHHSEEKRKANDLTYASDFTCISTVLIKVVKNNLADDNFYGSYFLNCLPIPNFSFCDGWKTSTFGSKSKLNSSHKWGYIPHKTLWNKSNMVVLKHS